MSTSEQKILQYLNEAHASEVGLGRVMQSQILMTSRGSYRSALEAHLDETHDHARRLKSRMSELGQDDDHLQALLGFAESAVGQVMALGKMPFDLVRGSGGEEKVLKNAKDACATEALEIATYVALERLARAVGDEVTAELAASIREEEEAMLDRVLREIPRLAEAVARADVDGEGSYSLADTGAADTARDVAATAKETAGKLEGRARDAARSARKVPGVARAEGQIKGVAASEGDLAIAGYDKLTASEIVSKLPELSQVDLTKVEVYERLNQKRSTVLSKIGKLRAQEPWPGYDELNVEEVSAVLAKSDQRATEAVRSYERAHKNRVTVLEAT
jgi:ferritin-like metal-binding protein YciE